MELEKSRRLMNKIRKIPEVIYKEVIDIDKWNSEEYESDDISSIDDMPFLTDVNDDGVYHIEDIQGLDKDKVERNFKILANKINEIINHINKETNE